MNPIRIARDYSRRRAVEKELLEALRLSRQKTGGAGVDVPRGADPVIAAAVMSIVKSHPEIVVVKNRNNLTLSYRSDVEMMLSPELQTSMKQGGCIALPNEELD